jgi:AraC-like DNA-binding protein
MGISRRSLQRRLGESGVKYVDLVGRARAQQAATMLVSSKQALAHIGFACGYSDQAHFSRDLKRRLGLTPAQFRSHRDRAALSQ